jgi:hypothetical protein
MTTLLLVELKRQAAHEREVRQWDALRSGAEEQLLERQGLTLVHFPIQRKHILQDTLGGFSISVNKNV